MYFVALPTKSRGTILDEAKFIMSSTKTQKLHGRKTTQKPGNRLRRTDRGAPKQPRRRAMKARGAAARRERATLARSGRPPASKARGM